MGQEHWYALKRGRGRNVGLATALTSSLSTWIAARMVVGQERWCADASAHLQPSTSSASPLPPFLAHARHSQLAFYGQSLLQQLPDSMRASVLLAITDLRQLQFMRVEREAGNMYSFSLSEPTDRVLDALCAVLLMAPTDVRNPPFCRPARDVV